MQPFDNQLKKILETKGRIEAIKYVKTTTRVSLKEAKDYVDSFAQANPDVVIAKGNNTWSGIIGLIVIIIVIWVGCNTCSGDEPKEETRQERVEKLFSAWDGSCPAVNAWIKKNINDPGSYKHIETRFWDMGAEIVVKTQFSAKNGFGGRVQALCEAKIDSTGRLLSANLVQ
ncbi:hypothetical protein JMG10_34025 [Nostoc ellipsosporum NOK]|nr:hypothetical protein [Nostoc ellipsosporum NOK]